jgi:hypothetical protein
LEFSALDSGWERERKTRKASNFSDAQKAFILKQGGGGDLPQSRYHPGNWKKKYAGLLPDGRYPPNAVFVRWLEFHAEAGRLQITDAAEAAGMLRGMMIMEPQRAVFLRQAAPPTEAQVRSRAEACADLFLRGSQAGC